MVLTTTLVLVALAIAGVAAYMITTDRQRERAREARVERMTTPAEAMAELKADLAEDQARLETDADVAQELDRRYYRGL